MKWVAYALALVVLVIWGLSLTVPPREQAGNDASHRLPRVARLQLADELPRSTAGLKPSPLNRSSSKLSSPKLSSSMTQTSSAVVTSSSNSASSGSATSMPKQSGAGNKSDHSNPSTASPKLESDNPKAGNHPPEPVKPVSQCFVVTRLGAKSQAESLISTMAKEGAQGQLRSRQESLSPLNWVLTEKYPSRHQALKALRHFQRRAIDSFLVTQGQWTNAISLGLYQSPRLARDVQHRLSQKGIRAHIEPYERSREVFSVRFQALSDEQAALLRKTVKLKQKDAEKEQIIACEGVASSDKSP